MAKSGTKFRYQRPPNRIYRVGPVIGTQPDCEYTSIQAAINQALADGHDLANPATIEIYYKSGGYVEDLTIYTGISLVGIALNDSSQFGRVYPVLNGTVTWTPIAGNRNSNQAYLENLNINGKNGADTFTYAGTVGSQLNIVNCGINKEQEDGFIAFRKTNTQGSGGGANRAQVNLYNSGIYMFDSVTAGLDAIVIQNGGRFNVLGSESYLEFEGGTLNTSVINLQGNANFRLDKGLVDGEATNLIKISGAGVFCGITYATLNTYGPNPSSIFNYVAGGTVRTKYSSLLVGSPTNVVAEGAGAGFLGFSFCDFDANNSGTSFGSDQGLSSYPPTLNVVIFSEGMRVSRNNSQTTAYVGFNNGFPSIQSAWDFLNQVGNDSAIILLQSNTQFTEDLNLSYAGAFGNFVIKGVDPTPAYKDFNGTFVGANSSIIGNHIIDPSNSNISFENINFINGGNGQDTIKQTGSTGGYLAIHNCAIQNDINDLTSLIKQDFNTVEQSLVITDSTLLYESDEGVALNLSPSIYGGYTQIVNCIFRVVPKTIADPTNLKMIYSQSRLTVTKSYLRGTGNQILECVDNTDAYRFIDCYVTFDILNGTGIYYTNPSYVEVRGNSFDIGNLPGVLLARDGVAAKAEILQISNSYLNNDGYNIVGGYGGGILQSGIDFAIGATAADTAQNIAAAINSSVNPAIQNIVYAYAYGDNVFIYPWNWTTAANAFEIFKYGHSFITPSNGAFYKVVGNGRAWTTKDINGADYYFWYLCADATVKINNTGAFYDVVGAGLAWTAKDDNGNDHYFWYRVTDGANFPQTDPGLAGTGHMIDILTADTAAQIATKTNLVVDALPEFESSVVTDTVTVENGGPAVATAATSGATVTNNNQTDPALAGTGTEINLFSSDSAAVVATKTQTAINTLVGTFTSTVLGATVNLVNDGEAQSVDVNAATITNSNPPANITPWGGGVDGAGGVFGYGSSNFNNNKAQNTITIGQFNETVVAF